MFTKNTGWRWVSLIYDNHQVLMNQPTTHYYENNKSKDSLRREEYSGPKSASNILHSLILTFSQYAWNHNERIGNLNHQFSGTRVSSTGCRPSRKNIYPP